MTMINTCRIYSRTQLNMDLNICPVFAVTGKSWFLHRFMLCRETGGSGVGLAVVNRLSVNDRLLV